MKIMHNSVKGSLQNMGSSVQGSLQNIETSILGTLNNIDISLQVNRILYLIFPYELLRNYPCFVGGYVAQSLVVFVVFCILLFNFVLFCNVFDSFWGSFTYNFVCLFGILRIHTQNLLTAKANTI